MPVKKKTASRSKKSKPMLKRNMPAKKKAAKKKKK
jgi:hypothetical protein